MKVPTIYKISLIYVVMIISCMLMFSQNLFAAKAKTGQKALVLETNQPSIILAPNDPQQWQQFQQALIKWRVETRKRIKYDDKLYNRPDFKWVSSAYNCYFLMMYDQAFFDCKNNKYTIEKFLADGVDQFGSYDIVVLWHAYPRIGLDQRNQFDFYRDMPGGLNALAEISAKLHAKGVKVYINYNPWDTGTRREGIADIDALAQIITAINADGIFLDTMDRGAEEFRQTLDNAKSGVALESELSLPVEEICTHHMSWAQWFTDSYVPGVLRNKWIEPRHMQHSIARWTRDKSKDLQSAWINGSGIMIWENIFGQWVGWSPRDSHILKTMSRIQKYYTYLFCSENWIPLVDNHPIENIYASLWFDDNCKLWTLINRSYDNIEGELLHVDIDDSFVYYDLVAGKEVIPDRGTKTLSGKIIPRGIGCFIAYKKNSIPENFKTFLASQAELNRFTTADNKSPLLHAKLKTVVATVPLKTTPDGMIAIDAMTGTQDVVFRCKEIGYYQSIEDEYVNQGPKSPFSPTRQTKRVNITKFAIDQTPVTNLMYKQFLDATEYKPRYIENFLKHWVGGKIPQGMENHPVIYVDLDDARAYAIWANKRLPREEEWQLAASGVEQRIYPWGNTLQNECYNTNTNAQTTSVTAFPKGRTPDGIWDMCGNTWELTESEYSDGRNRFCILKGGSCYRAIGSDWYFDGGIQTANFAAKQLLLYPGIDRCSTIGFRCVVDLL